MELEFIREIKGYLLYLKKEEKEIVKCKKCHKTLKEGYFCGTYNALICRECHKNWDWAKCIYDTENQHEHTNIKEIRIVE